ncbi:DUF2380 domain-containing protein [Methylomonas sp. AM2-LC]|uniref:DUF2380 domain-containing protein n=1 Tax=Methylomonas sp. AM2-LC TaxID=3153301 RepID=UPI0032676618
MNKYKLLALILFCITFKCGAQTRIAVLDFQLNDLTLLANTQTELQRTASMAPLLIESLNLNDDYHAISIPSTLQAAANNNFADFYHFPAQSAKLGRQLNVDWMVISQHIKPSFLFSYLQVLLIDVNKETQVARYDIELKGSHAKVTQHSIMALAKKLQATLSEPSHHIASPIP